MGHTLWLMLHDEEFMRTTDVPANVFPRGSARFIADLAATTWDSHRTLVDDTLFDLAVEGDTTALKRSATDVDQAVAAYVNLDNFAIQPQSLPVARERCREWVENRVLELQVARASQAIDQGRPSDARAHIGAMLSVRRNGYAGGEHINVDQIPLRKAPLPGAIPTGLEALDRAWEGGYRPGELGMVAAATGVGKSMMLCAMAAEAYWRGANVLYYTFELSAQQIKERIMAGILQKSYMSITDWQDELLNTGQNLYGLNIPPGSDIDIRTEPQTWPEIMSDLEQYKRDWGKYPDVLMLDSADDVAPLSESDQAEHAQLKKTFTWLRDQTMSKNLRVWTSAQLTRDAVEKAYVNLKNIGGAYAKAQKSHYVLGFAQTDHQRNDPAGPKMMLYVLKDSLHGTGHGALELKANFGFGGNGYPGYEVLDTQGLPHTGGNYGPTT